MLNQELSGENYSVVYDADTVTLIFSGQLVLRGYREYAPIMDMMMEVAATNPAVINLDLRNVSFLSRYRGRVNPSKICLSSYLRCNLGLSSLIVF